MTKNMILVDQDNNIGYSVPVNTETQPLFDALTSQGTTEEEYSTYLQSLINMSRRISLKPLDDANEIGGDDGEFSITRDGHMSVYSIDGDGRVTSASKTKELELTLKQYDDAGVFSFLQGINSNLKVNTFYYRSDKLFFDSQTLFDKQIAYYGVYTYPTKKVTDPEFANVIVENYDTLGEYYADLGQYVSIPLLGTVSSGIPGIGNPEHIGAFYDVIDGIPTNAKVIAPDLLKSGTPYKFVFYDSNKAPYGMPTTFISVGATDPMVIRTKAYNYTVNGFSINTENDIDGDNATIFQGGSPYDLISQFFLDFTQGPSRNVTSELGDRLSVKYFTTDNVEMPFDDIAGKYIVDTGAMAVGDTFKMVASYDVLQTEDVTINPDVDFIEGDGINTLVSTKVMTVVEDVFVDAVSLMTLPYDDNGTYKIKTFAIYEDGSISDVSGSLVSPGPDTVISTDGTPNSYEFALALGNTGALAMNLSVSVNILSGDKPNQATIRSFYKDGGSVEDQPKFIAGAEDGGLFYNSGTHVSEFKSIPISMASSGEIYFWITDADILEYLGSTFDSLQSNMLIPQTTSYETSIPSHFTIRSARFPSVRYVSAPIDLESLRTSGIRLNNDFVNGSSALAPLAGDHLLIELYNKDDNNNFKVINIIPAYVITADFGTSPKSSSIINAV